MTTVLLLVSGSILLLIILALIYRIINLVSIAKGEDANKASTSNKINAVLFPIFLVLGFGAIFWYSGVAKEYFLPEAASIHGKETDQLFWITMAVVGLAFFLTHILLFVFPFTYQYKENRKAWYQPHNNALEIVWTVVPALVMATLIMFGVKTWTDITSPEEEAALEVEILGRQFGWEIRYGGKDKEIGAYNIRKIDSDGINSMGIDFTDIKSTDDFVAGEIWLPKGKPVKLRIRALDVIHSVFMPHFRVKMDAVPGMPTKFQFTPTLTTEEMRDILRKEGKENADKFKYELACTEICGEGHFGMRKIIRVVEPEEFEKWYAKQKTFAEKNPDFVSALKAKGEFAGELKEEANSEVATR
ncbi:cytochrome c oxidase subunit II [Sediminitomix flava]|uniref:Cytochrome c oxidase subunit 2 n=1 Tax=Sediminitomix flava TaxID=379075 RepID=A0A315ZBB2_SEDFL|nr:cytochrome c oxidase subunit II [Sediminitomix flava]PWJ42650.1 cytochrome c oxidase subunit 2 [Sediminitomix flava]